ncbi:hypothetical protein AMAG_04647 [Allomyces macrogynus ATCC 38327]|uniref:Peptidyl-prolyl cis-trans isomerase n=1 Tax=Allomyces macrogynus (strain ATCC 38327) TaxID=578462 RepID=A0A0L0S602_ALLM3|nr:Peptidyl-prolyl cis-trans isomerase NIMA-interacting protein 1 [Allomyces javanicus]KAJ3358652.1 Peptidyl-prolyl cis-trans isomerase NIMA-interacting protein 1 [Allomyces javanicus]KNE57799.1 hypothetical protein AMAG_04647 [Allomyces macrogynus ATCC 38327]|eukprot:KNE57799.1 hypothetical protein AMAG_04647 [Allomyces macrogynus ATCC 38327]
MPTPPAPWEERFSQTKKRAYYYNPETNQSQWEFPTESSGAANETVRASHLLVKHRESRRPSSWRQERITISKDEALQQILEFRQQIVSGETDLPTLAQQYSDCSSARVGGDLGPFKRGQMQKSFEDATFALQVGELSQPVFSDSGVHLILRTA